MMPALANDETSTARAGARASTRRTCSLTYGRSPSSTGRAASLSSRPRGDQRSSATSSSLRVCGGPSSAKARARSKRVAMGSSQSACSSAAVAGVSETDTLPAEATREAGVHPPSAAPRRKTRSPRVRVTPSPRSSVT